VTVQTPPTPPLALAPPPFLVPEHGGVPDQQLDTPSRELLAAKADAARALAERALAVKALEKAHRDLEQFAYAASHDLKAPLRGIGNVSDWLEEDLAGALTAKSREHLELLRSRVLRMEALIDGMQAYVRASRTKELREPIALASVLDEVLALLAPAPGVVTMDIPEAMPLLEVQRFPFQQVWSNLLGNALKHGAREGAAIRVTARDAGAAWEFSVSDNGPGIAPDFQQRIFGIFQTLKARDEVEGAGIGLAIVRTVVDDRGGQVWVESEPDKGATFFFTWPKS
jgi:light-regulated signal transduction histidine kinase (bacteriophytochrome)